MAGALDDITVLDLTRGAAGALATMFLGDNGARVIRIVGDKGHVLRDGGFRVWDRGKTCVLSDGIETASDAVEPGLGTILAGADVLIEDFAPGARPAWLEHRRLGARNPRLVTCSVTAYGESGPYRDEPAVDDLVLARAGVLAGMPGFRPAPVHVVHPLPSTGAGVMAALGIAAALYEREHTGRGRRVATSLLAGALLYHPKVVSEHLQPHVFQTNPFGSAPFYSVYACGDAEWVQLGCVHPGFIRRAADLMGIGELLDDPVYGHGHNPETAKADAHLRATLKEVMATRAYGAWAEAFEANDIPFARAGRTSEALDDPQIRHNEMVVSLRDPEIGELAQMGVPIKLSATPGRVQEARHAELSDLQKLADELADEMTTAPSVPSGGRQVQPDRLPLAGVRVLEITNLIAGPMAGRLLADLGADVMKLEPPGGDISRPIGRTYFYSVNFGKRSIAVDTARPDGKAIVTRLARSCDVMLANLRPGATSRMGIGNDVDHDLIEAQISGYGLTGPYAHRPGIDPLAQALMGLERAQGGEGNPPSFPAQLAPTDFTTGAMAALGTTLALYARRRKQVRGQRVEVNLLDGGILLSSEWFTRYRSRPERPLADKGQYGLNPCHRLYQLRDGFIYVAAHRAEQRTALLDAFGLPELATSDPSSSGAHANDTAPAKALAAAIGKLNLAQATALLSAKGIDHVPVAAAESAVFFDDPQCQTNGLAVTQRHSKAGQLTAVCHYVAFDGCDDTGGIRPTPLLGEHNGDILREAGFRDDEIAALEREKLVVTEDTKLEDQGA